MADGMAQECRAQIVAGRMRTAVHVNDTPRMWTCDVEDEYLLEVRRIHDFKSWRIEKSRTCVRLAANEWRIQIGLAGAVLIKRTRPGLKRNIRAARASAEAR